MQIPISDHDSKINNQQEIERVIELTGASENQIEFNNEGYWSRVYVVNDGEYIVKFPKYDTVNYSNEAKVLTLLDSLELPVNTQKLKWLADDCRLIVISGVKGNPLSKLDHLTLQQKQSIGQQIGTFLKQLHSLEPDFYGQNLNDELQEYKILYDDCANFYSKYFTKDEKKVLDDLMHTRLPTARKELGENLVFSHADIWESNLLLDENGVVGIIDCSNAGYFDEAADFCVEDEVIRNFILDNYDASENLRKKVDIKYDMSVIAGPSFGITLWGESFVVEKWVPIIRKVITKYRKD